MPTDIVVLQGEILADGSLKARTPVNLPPGPVEITLRPVPASPRYGILDLIALFEAEERTSNRPPRSAEEIDATVRELREQDDERSQALEAIQEECRRLRKPGDE